MSESVNEAIPGLGQKKVFKIIVLGDSGVGKTCLTYRFCEGKFLDKSEATIGVDFRERTIRIRNEDIKLQLWDTAGQERFRKSMVQHYYRNVHAVVIVYDVTKPETFHSITSWMSEVESHGLTGAPRVLVGNKCDCGAPADRLATLYAQRLADRYGMPSVKLRLIVDTPPDLRSETKLAMQDLLLAKSKEKYMRLFETSALLESECDNVESIFMTLAHKLYSHQPFRVVSVEGELGPRLVTLNRRKRNATNNDTCLCS